MLYKGCYLYDKGIGFFDFCGQLLENWDADTVSGIAQGLRVPDAWLSHRYLTTHFYSYLEIIHFTLYALCNVLTNGSNGLVTDLSASSYTLAISLNQGPHQHLIMWIT